ncbi:hypothetical protein [Lewinella sp. LCG006]|uniref:hypothetical protein n=1 Tax=Lewinella sp. LCG006 TaxID=3231911 RepID=UPI00346119D7
MMTKIYVQADKKSSFLAYSISLFYQAQRLFRSLFFMLTIFIATSCEKSMEEECPEGISLTSAIVGEWELIEQLGFPYSSNQFEPVVNTSLYVIFTDDGTITFVNETASDVAGVYQVDDTTETISITTTVSFEWQVSYYSTCEFIYDLITDEGLSRLKFRKR